jgi:hypothetical protein
MDVHGSYAINNTNQKQWVFMGACMHICLQGRGQNGASMGNINLQKVNWL